MSRPLGGAASDSRGRVRRAAEWRGASGERARGEEREGGSRGARERRGGVGGGDSVSSTVEVRGMAPGADAPWPERERRGKIRLNGVLPRGLDAWR